MRTMAVNTSESSQLFVVTKKSRRSSVVKTRTSVRENPGSLVPIPTDRTIPTIYEFSVWKEYGAPPYNFARAFLVFSK